MPRASLFESESYFLLGPVGTLTPRQPDACSHWDLQSCIEMPQYSSKAPLPLAVMQAPGVENQRGVAADCASSGVAKQASRRTGVVWRGVIPGCVRGERRERLKANVNEWHELRTRFLIHGFQKRETVVLTNLLLDDLHMLGLHR